MKNKIDEIKKTIEQYYEYGGKAHELFSTKYPPRDKGNGYLDDTELRKKLLRMQDLKPTRDNIYQILNKTISSQKTQFKIISIIQKGFYDVLKDLSVENDDLKYSTKQLASELYNLLSYTPTEKYHGGDVRVLFEFIQNIFNAFYYKGISIETIQSFVIPPRKNSVRHT